MFEVIIERPRYNSHGPHRKGRRGERSERAFHRAPAKEPMGMNRWGTKHLNENLAPLKRFLKGRLGHPWSAVRSEICALISLKSAVQKHVLDHVKQFVEENPVMIDGVPHHPGASGSLRDQYRPLRAHPQWPDFYVCPKTGLLRMPRPVRRKAAPSA